MKRCIYLVIALALAIGAFVVAQQPPAVNADNGSTDTLKSELGKAMFFDKGLSANGTQACAACHAPEAGFVGADSAINAGGAVYEGAIPNRYGNRKPPTSAYAGDSPNLHQDENGDWFGGMFWDGRATGDRLGDPLVEQAQGPFLNPLEQALANAQVLCERVKKASYAQLFEQVWGAGTLDCAKDANGVYEKVARSVAAYEESPEVNPFSSKFDLFWDNALAKGKDPSKIVCGMGPQGCGAGGNNPNRWSMYRGLGLTDQELTGLAVFNDRAACSSCHTLTAEPGKHPLFTDFGYDNIGVPKNPANPFYKMPKAWNPDGKNWVDYGLGGYLRDAGQPAEVYEPQLGKQKVPTLRNVDLRPAADTVKAYGHNGYFKSLNDIVLFYHWRGCMGGGMGGGMDGCMGNMFDAPEVPETVATLNMFPRPQVDNIVAFLKTLSDGYKP